MNALFAYFDFFSRYRTFSIPGKVFVKGNQAFFYFGEESAEGIRFYMKKEEVKEEEEVELVCSGLVSPPIGCQNVERSKRKKGTIGG